MSTESSQNNALRRVRTIAEYQFGAGAGEGLFPEGCEFILSTTGRIRQVMYNGHRLATLRAQDGLFTLSIQGGSRLKMVLPPPRSRVILNEEVAAFVAQGKNTFAKHVLDADPDIRCGDEVLVVATDDRLLATGSAVLSGREMLSFNYGVAVKVRQGSESRCSQEK